MCLYAVASRDSGLAMLRCLSNILWVKTSLQALPWGKAELLVPVERVSIVFKTVLFCFTFIWEEVVYTCTCTCHSMQKGVRTAYRRQFSPHVCSGLQTWWQHLHLLSCSPALLWHFKITFVQGGGVHFIPALRRRGR